MCVYEPKSVRHGDVLSLIVLCKGLAPHGIRCVDQLPMCATTREWIDWRHRSIPQLQRLGRCDTYAASRQDPPSGYELDIPPVGGWPLGHLKSYYF